MERRISDDLKQGRTKVEVLRRQGVTFTRGSFWPNSVPNSRSLQEVVHSAKLQSQQLSLHRFEATQLRDGVGGVNFISPCQREDQHGLLKRPGLETQSRTKAVSVLNCAFLVMQVHHCPTPFCMQGPKTWATKSLKPLLGYL